MSETFSWTNTMSSVSGRPCEADLLLILALSTAYIDQMGSLR